MRIFNTESVYLVGPARGQFGKRGRGRDRHAREKRDETFGTINVCRICLIDDSHAITHGRGGREREGRESKKESSTCHM